MTEDEYDWEPGTLNSEPLAGETNCDSFSLMKSAYELAMERLEKQSPSVKLTDSQRAQLAEIDSLYKSKSAEKELLLSDEIRREQAAGKFSEVEKLQQQLSSELRRLNEECEAKKEKVRQSTE